MADKRRALPPWMAKRQEAKAKEPPKSRRKRKASRSVFYCMNETELVEAALSLLSSGAGEDVAALRDHQIADEADDTRVKIRDKAVSLKTNAKPLLEVLQESSDCSDALGTTCVSETDLDVTEMETVPYTKSPQHRGPEGQRSGAVHNHSSGTNVEAEAEKRQERPQMKADSGEDDDSLRLVREIFFT